MEVQESTKVRQYSNNQKLLLIGEGDFSFSLSLAKAFVSATNITVASLDIRDGLGRQYNNGNANMEELEKLGCTVVRGVNIHSMTSADGLNQYDRIVFHFPHAGKHRNVVKGFMENAIEMVKDKDGEIHVTHKTIYPFNKWDMKTIAEETGLRLIQQMQFNKWTFPGHSNNRGSGSNCDASFPFGSVVTFMFKK
ncbi:hypothetical protein EUTSA_v10012292mg [Eutrema salsugineum]|uniref:25S rRNA (uridine-N(3))-methyltransferase BMT5-like domain-containing protein n=1 Tax=Eutrema salsugineum TaxID=72664 RepID=V4KRT1_EUTSA|nr:uncharacterized protein At4g26485 [Eutrema salsugineum]ESQ30048.1 hypothetical protein EUTSA_v10012292mg [Eutrema salsugineum]